MVYSYSNATFCSLPGRLLKRVNEVGGDVLSGWPTVPGWWRDSAASPWRALATSRSPYTCEGDEEKLELLYLQFCKYMI